MKQTHAELTKYIGKRQPTAHAAPAAQADKCGATGRHSVVSHHARRQSHHAGLNELQQHLPIFLFQAFEVCNGPSQQNKMLLGVLRMCLDPVLQITWGSHKESLQTKVLQLSFSDAWNALTRQPAEYVSAKFSADARLVICLYTMILLPAAGAPFLLKEISVA